MATRPATTSFARRAPRAIAIATAIVGAAATIAPTAACGAFDSDATDDPGQRPASGDAASADGTSGDAATGGDGDAALQADGSDAGACTATGAPKIDATYTKVPIPLRAARSVVTPSGDVYTIGRSGCGGVANQMSLHHVAPNGTGSAPLGCFGAAEAELGAAMAETPGGFLLASTRFLPIARAQLRLVTTAGVSTDLDSFTGSPSPGYATVAAYVAGQPVWGGYAKAAGGPRTGFLRVVGGSPTVLSANEVPLAVAARASQLTVLLSASPSAGGDYVVVRRYNLSGTSLSEDTAFALNDRTKIPVLIAPDEGVIDPDGLIVTADSSTFAVPKSASWGLFVLKTTLANPVDFSSFGAPQLSAWCDGSIVVGALKAGDVVEIVRYVDGAATGAPVSFSGGGTPRQLGTASDGRIYAAVTQGDGTLMASRVIP